MTNEEWSLRVQLAACYRIFHYLGWSELIFNHITVKIPVASTSPHTDHSADEPEQFLINPYGLLYDEICASNLVKVDINGNVLEDTHYKVNPAGMTIHSAIHAARPDITCIAHTHTNAGMAVACQQSGLRIDNFYSVLLHNRVAYHDFEGITVQSEEKVRLVENMGDNNLMVLRNHGLLTCGDTIASAFFNMWALQRACEVQVKADSTGKKITPIAESIGDKSEALLKIQMSGSPWGELEFNAMVRKMDKLDPSYKD